MPNHPCAELQCHQPVTRRKRRRITAWERRGLPIDVEDQHVRLHDQATSVVSQVVAGGPGARKTPNACLGARRRHLDGRHHVRDAAGWTNHGEPWHEPCRFGGVQRNIRQ
jgi:hypothetical protein